MELAVARFPVNTLARVETEDSECTGWSPNLGSWYVTGEDFESEFSQWVEICPIFAFQRQGQAAVCVFSQTASDLQGEPVTSNHRAHPVPRMRALSPGAGAGPRMRAVSQRQVPFFCWGLQQTAESRLPPVCLAPLHSVPPPQLFPWTSFHGPSFWFPAAPPVPRSVCDAQLIVAAQKQELSVG